MTDTTDHRWLLLIHQIPNQPSYLRVKVWRRLQRLGAVPVKNSVYVLPKTEQTQEDLQWVLREIVEGGGDGSLCEARFIDGMDEHEIEALLRAPRKADYRALAADARALADRVPARRKLGDEREGLAAEAARLRRRLGEIAAIDYLGAGGREAAEGLVADLEARLGPEAAAAPRTEAARREDFQGRTWVTRKGIHVDRMASAWLIRRFIDPRARFKWVPPRGYQPARGEVRFDMYDAEVTHEGDRCTFEVLIRRFELADPALAPIAEIVHDIDLKDGKFERPETEGIARLIAGIALGTKDDDARLAGGAAVFEGLYNSFRPRPGGTP